MIETDFILEEIAEDYLSGVDSESLKDIANSSNINSEEYCSSSKVENRES